MKHHRRRSKNLRASR